MNGVGAIKNKELLKEAMAKLASYEDVKEICENCKLNKFHNDICNKYNSLNKFVGSQVERLLIKNGELERKLA